MRSDGRLRLLDGVRARRLIHACERTVTPARDSSSEEQAARVPTNAGLARNCTLVPQVYRAAVPPITQKNHTSMVFFAPWPGQPPPRGVPHEAPALCQGGEPAARAL